MVEEVRGLHEDPDLLRSDRGADRLRATTDPHSVDFDVAAIGLIEAGKQIRAVSQNPIGAEVVGINVKKIYILTYGLGVALAGIAGSLLTQFYTIYPTAGASFGFRALIVVVVGGLGSIPGAFFAGIFLGLLEQMSALFISPSYSDMIVFVTFIIILVVRQVMILRRR